MDALTSPKAPKHTQIFTKKRAAPFLFYKFYKFRRNLLFGFKILQGYRQLFQPQKHLFQPQKQLFQPELLID